MKKLKPTHTTVDEVIAVLLKKARAELDAAKARDDERGVVRASLDLAMTEKWVRWFDAQLEAWHNAGADEAGVSALVAMSEAVVWHASYVIHTLSINTGMDPHAIIRAVHAGVHAHEEARLKPMVLGTPK
jgi:hypothetical protein